MSNEPATDFAPPTGPTVGGTESLGAWLAQARAGYNAEQRDVARHLGLNPAIIQAIEADDFERLGPPVFVRGYLSRYARLLNLPEQAVLERYQRQSRSSQDPPPLKVAHPLRRQTRVRDLRGPFYLLLLVGIGWTAIQNLNALDPGRLLALWSDGDGGSATQTSGPSTTAISQTQYPFQSAPSEATTAAATPSSPPLAGDTLPSTHSDTTLPATDATRPQPPAAPASPISPPRPDTAPTAPGAVTATLATTSSITASTSETVTAHSAGEAKLLLEFSNDCWVEVKDAQGNVLANGLMKANSTRTLSGSAPFKVTLGNAPAARIILDDRLVDTEFYVPRRGTVSRFTLDRDQP